jgi:glycosyltransferase involved in cell wall biosynthesis
MIVLYNANKYLGGGETLLIRFAEYLKAIGADFIVVCARDSYIERNIGEGVRCVALSCDVDYYYLSKYEKRHLLDEFEKTLQQARQVKFVTFCMRDLHTAIALSGTHPGWSITHLVLHIQDDLYTGQSLVDKVRYKLTGARRFNHVKNVEFNRSLLKRLNDKKALICMAEVIAKYWSSQFQIDIPRENIVPLPSFGGIEVVASYRVSNRSIIWLGRLVDFKMPSVLAMIRFLSLNQEYTLTIVGAGDSDRIRNAMRANDVHSDRVRFIGELKYEAIGPEILKHSIGYAMGTSLVELAMYRIPVVVALASYDHKEYADPICGGLFFDQPLGCDGSELILGEAASNITTLQKAFDDIDADYEGISAKCHDYAKEHFSSDVNFQRYFEIITAAESFVSPNLDLPYPECPPLRRLLFKSLAPQ